jgi:hypothetical protein
VSAHGANDADAGNHAGHVDGAVSAASTRVQVYDFARLLAAFDAARAADATVRRWSATGMLDTARRDLAAGTAWGGDLATHHAMVGTLGGMGLSAAQQVVADADFGRAPQGLTAGPGHAIGDAPRLM